jgi:hypothetical protein
MVSALVMVAVRSVAVLIGPLGRVTWTGVDARPW